MCTPSQKALIRYADEASQKGRAAGTPTFEAALAGHELAELTESGVLT